MPFSAYTRQAPVHYKCGSAQGGWPWPTVHGKRSGEFFGAELGAAGRTQAIRKPKLDIAWRIDGVLQTDGIFERLRRKPIE
jgi:hypothetical protein